MGAPLLRAFVIVVFRRDKDADSDVESLLRYTHSGFHPVRPGDVYHDGRYKVIRKLGHGGYSTVWLSEEIAYCYLNSFADWKYRSGGGTKSPRCESRIS